MARIELETILTPDGWQIGPLLDQPEKEGISRTFNFSDYAAGKRFTIMCADLAEKNDHHPEIRLLFGKVKIISSTHDSGGITIKDTELAAKINQLYNSL